MFFLHFSALKDLIILHIQFSISFFIFLLHIQESILTIIYFIFLLIDLIFIFGNSKRRSWKNYQNIHYLSEFDIHYLPLYIRHHCLQRFPFILLVDSTPILEWNLPWSPLLEIHKSKECLLWLSSPSFWFTPLLLSQVYLTIPLYLSLWYHLFVLSLCPPLRPFIESSDW
jgi:hypothetical protein